MDRPLSVFARRIREKFEEHPAHAEAFFDALIGEGCRQLVVAPLHQVPDVRAGLAVVREAYARAVKS